MLAEEVNECIRRCEGGWRRRQNELPCNYAAQNSNLQSGSSAGLRGEERFWLWNPFNKPWQLICDNDDSETQKYVVFFIRNLQSTHRTPPRRECGVHIQFIFPAMPTYCLSSCPALNRPPENHQRLRTAWFLRDNQLANWAEPDFQNEQIFGPKMNKPIETNHPFWKLKQCWQYVCLYLLVAIAPHTNLPLEVCLFRDLLGKSSVPKGKIGPARLLQTLPKSTGSEPSHRCDRLLLPRVYERVQVRGCKWQQLPSFLPPARRRSDEQRE